MSDPKAAIRVEVERTLPGELTLKNPNRYLVEGWLVGAARMREVSLRVGEKRFASRDIELHRPDVQSSHFPDRRCYRTIFSGFSIPVILEPVEKGEKLEVALEAVLRDGSRVTRRLGGIRLLPWREPPSPVAIPPRLERENLLVVCMATYNPAPGPFLRQIESIRAQSHQNWICIISDDNSPEAGRKVVREAVKGDDRFTLVENRHNVGFYRNFERALELVPREAKLVALADQDDIWYPEKLARSVERFGGRTMLVYCDMKIVDSSRKLLSGSYWKNRKNYYKSGDLDLLTLANTVTGAASVFRRELLDLALPFPPRYGEVFHDQWLAILAAANGGIEYVDEPLYEYVQYGDNVIGHSDFSHVSHPQFVLNYVTSALRARLNPFGFARKLLCSLAGIPGYAFHTSLLRQNGAKHVTTLARTALLRRLEPEARRLIEMTQSAPGLFRIHLKVQRNRETLNDLEYQLLFGMISAPLFRWAAPLFELFVGSRLDRWLLSRRAARPVP